MIATFFCACALCCAHNHGAPTASGAWPREGVTAAHATLPFGTVVHVPGHGRRVIQDRCKPGVVDVFVSSHVRARRLGVVNGVRVVRSPKSKATVQSER